MIMFRLQKCIDDYPVRKLNVGTLKSQKLERFKYTNRSSCIIYTTHRYTRRNRAHKMMYPNISNICGILKKMIDVILCVTALKYCDGHIRCATECTMIKIMNVAEYINSA
ncbi:uncharacterized protein LOC143431373 isoform X1 [Xylocopa sonorina]|uniref:uncharacterized protein LOC143431373 isoform X1 n=1 Tax=Xylocopa sonorina TaxID=1818115 RepID=UPI00403B04C4